VKEPTVKQMKGDKSELKAEIYDLILSEQYIIQLLEQQLSDLDFERKDLRSTLTKAKNKLKKISSKYEEVTGYKVQPLKH